MMRVTRYRFGWKLGASWYFIQRWSMLWHNMYPKGSLWQIIALSLKLSCFWNLDFGDQQTHIGVFLWIFFLKSKFFWIAGFHLVRCVANLSSFWRQYQLKSHCPRWTLNPKDDQWRLCRRHESTWNPMNQIDPIKTWSKLLFDKSWFVFFFQDWDWMFRFVVVVVVVVVVALSSSCPSCWPLPAKTSKTLGWGPFANSAHGDWAGHAQLEVL